MKTALIACCNQKLDHAAQAADLYQSPLFKKALAWAQKNCEQTFILSAKHGLVTLDQVIDPYDLTLTKMPAYSRLQWAQATYAQMGHIIQHATEVTFLAGHYYVEHLAEWLLRDDIPVSVPMQGLGIGYQLQWLTNQLAA